MQLWGPEAQSSIIVVNLPLCKARVFKRTGSVQGTTNCLVLLEEC